MVMWFSLLFLFISGERSLSFTAAAYSTLGISAVTAFTLIFMATSSQRSASASETYERRMMALTPAFSEQERKALIGAWGYVMSKADYDALMAQMEELGVKYHITLPARRDQ
jgi:predicted nucleic acid-binding protein